MNTGNTDTHTHAQTRKQKAGLMCHKGLSRSQQGPQDNLSFGFWRQGVKEGVCVVRLLAADRDTQHAQIESTRKMTIH